MRFGVLGPVRAWSADGSVIPIRAPRLRALLAMLMLDVGRSVEHARLINGLYRDLPGNAANALQSQVSRLRRLLPDAEIEHNSVGYRLIAAPSDVDAVRCAELVAAGRGAEALGLWRGPALADVDAPFVPAAQARLEELRVDAATSHGDLAELQSLVAAYPLQERLRAALMRALHSAGRQTEALAAFDDARRTLAEELGVDPSPELAAAHLEVLRDTGTRRRLPAQLTSFVGRAVEVRGVCELLNGGSRLVTLIGSGGAGKTRLAIESAGQALGEVYFVDLAAVQGGTNGPFTPACAQRKATSSVPQRGSAGGGPGTGVVLAIQGAVGIRDASLPSLTAPVAVGSDPDPVPVADGLTGSVERLAAAVADRPVLLVVDNCEHVVEQAATVIHTLLGECQNLRVLATSREPLGITGETLYPVPPLEPASALRLFTDRALAVRPDFVPDEAVVSGICQALDGIPLAIELAAARVRSLPVAEIAARLDDRFRLLSHGSRTAAPRHRTLHAVVEWSWDLLTAAERALAARLTVFAGGATLDAIRAVCGLSDVDVLASLVDKSLVEVSGDRYRMLDTIRAFCAARATEDIRPRHAAHFLRVAQEAEPHLRLAEQVAWLDALAADNDNLAAAVRWAIGHDHRTALELTAALTTYWWFRGLRTEGARFADDLLRATAETPVPGMVEEYAMALFAAWPVATGDQTARMRLAARLTAAMTGPPRYPIMTMIWGMALGAPTEIGDDVMARRYELLGDDPWSSALGRLGEALLVLYSGSAGAGVPEIATIDPRHAGARRLLEASLAAFRDLGDRWGTSLVLSQLAEVALLTGEPCAAVEFLDEARMLVGELDATEDLADLLRMRAQALASSGDLAGAGADYRAAVELARRAGSAAALADCHLGLTELARLRGDLNEARTFCDLAWANAPVGWYGPEQTRCRILLERGRIALAAQDTPAARRVLRDALQRTGSNHILATTIRRALVAVPLDVVAEAGTAERLHRIARRAYRVEAELIGNDQIPPLHESLDEMLARPFTWLGVPGEDGLPIAFLAWQRLEGGEIDIHRLCVDPDHVRRGHARTLVNALPEGPARVSTAAANTPAVRLYQTSGFRRVGTSEPEPGMRLAHFTRPARATTATAAAAGAG